MLLSLSLSLSHPSLSLSLSLAFLPDRMLLRHSRQTCALSFWSRIYIAAALLREQKVSQAPRTDTGCCAFRAVASRQDRKLVRHSGQRLATLPPSVSLPLVSLQNRKLVRHTGQRLAAVVSRSSIPPGQKVSPALRPETRCSLSLTPSGRLSKTES